MIYDLQQPIDRSRENLRMSKIHHEKLSRIQGVKVNLDQKFVGAIMHIKKQVDIENSCNSTTEKLNAFSESF